MKDPGIFIDSGVHDIDLTLSFLGSASQPMSCYAVGSIALHEELAEIHDVDNAIGMVKWYPLSEGSAAPITYYYTSRIMYVKSTAKGILTQTSRQPELGLEPSSKI